MDLNRFFFWLIRRISTLTRFFSPHERSVQIAAASVALILGFWGWTIKHPPQDFGGQLNNVFRTLQLITMQFPGLGDENISWQLHVGRLAVPAAAALATFHILVGAITRPVRLALLPNMRGHAVICGEERLAHSALQRLARGGRQVVIVGASITDQRRDDLEGIGLTVVQADPMDEAVAKSLNLRHASAVFLAGERDLDNLNLAVLMIETAGRRPSGEAPLTLAVSIENEFLASELDRSLDGLSRQFGVQYHRICADREGLQLELDRFVPALIKVDPQEPSHVLVIGLEGQWQQILSTFFVSLQDHPDRNARVTLVLDADETLLFEVWLAERPEWTTLIDVQLLGPDVMAQNEPAFESAPHLVLVLRKDEEALATMLSLRRPGTPLRTEQSAILVKQTREDRFLARLSSASLEDRNLADLVAFGGVIPLKTIERVMDRFGESLAIALHAHYCLKQEEAGSGSPAALAAWNQLPENLRDANRVAARHAPVLFAAIGWSRDDKGKGDVMPVPDAAQLEILARVEHRRWMADRIDRGWRFGATRDDIRRLHPSLVDFDTLSDAEKQKDRDSVLAMLEILSRENFMLRPRNTSPAPR